MRRDPLAGARLPNADDLRLTGRAGDGAARHQRGAERRRLRGLPPPRRDGERQDRNLHPRHARGAAARAHGDDARPRDRAHARLLAPPARALRRRRRHLPLVAHGRRALRRVGPPQARRGARRHRHALGRLRARHGTWASSSWTRSTRPLIDSRSRPTTTAATRPSCARTASAPSSSSARPRPRWRSFHNARHGKYRYLQLPSRIAGRAMARAEIVDMREVVQVEGQARGLLARAARSHRGDARARRAVDSAC